MFELTMAEQAGIRRGWYAGLAALEAGREDEPVALFLPGFTGSKEDFLGVLGTLAADGFHVVAVDLPGQYESPGPDDPSGYTVAALGRRVLAVIDELGGGPVHLLGHSFGGLVAREVVIAEPLAVESLALLGSGPAAIAGPRAVALNAMRPVLERGGLPAVWAALRSADPTPYPPEVLDFLERRFFASSAEGLKSIGEQLLAEPDRVGELAAVAAAAGIPLLVVHGDGDDAWAPGIQAEMAVRLGARHEVIPAAQHSPAWQNPAGTIAVLETFWRDASARKAA
jgi:pimeloyl-ACP methyl ester carboxylesterase